MHTLRYILPNIFLLPIKKVYILTFIILKYAVFCTLWFKISSKNYIEKNTKKYNISMTYDKKYIYKMRNEI